MCAEGICGIYSSRNIKQVWQWFMVYYYECLTTGETYEGQ